MSLKNPLAEDAFNCDQLAQQRNAFTAGNNHHLETTEVISTFKYNDDA